MLLTARDVAKTFTSADGPVAVLRGIDLDLGARESLALTGESGSGKSTLLHMIGGLDAPDSGSILINGADIAGMDDRARARMRRETVGVIFQQFNLIPSLNVADNISFQARLGGRHDASWESALITRMGLAEQVRKYPEQLSGGQQQRVAIARTLAARPALVLADEPTGNLDEDTAQTVLDLMLELVAEAGAGLLMVTHSIRLAERMDRQVHLRAGHIA
ncbi:ABC transporter ATP-binding protein [Octadecabacter sp. SW4]|uniref:ABC transporter ATP-binding protein n=1 Tax=Octadecabacter sp. SW4 TaxID=2602067 RepID=UPI0011C1E142|nr:ABC transporter ATP-binding protein [Octadecabacter sp. SW4]QEE34246.1 ABC transporter ATP-binding protein [Octadecabacter sp. SW4]